MSEPISERYFSQQQIEKIVAAVIVSHQREGGATVNAEGENLIGARFYAVAVFQRRTRTIERRDLTSNIVRRFVENNIDLLAFANCAVGTWYDATGNVSILDISFLIASKSRAVEIGKEFNQIAIYDLHKKEEIYLGGDGQLSEDKRHLSDKDILHFVIEAVAGKHK